MGLFGLGKGIVKTIIGIVEDDPEAIVKGLKKTAINAVTTVVSMVSGEGEESITEDSDDDI